MQLGNFHTKLLWIGTGPPHPLVHPKEHRAAKPKQMLLRGTTPNSFTEEQPKHPLTLQEAGGECPPNGALPLNRKMGVLARPPHGHPGHQQSPALKDAVSSLWEMELKNRSTGTSTM